MIDNKTRIVFFAANPNDTSRLAIDTEFNEIKQLHLKALQRENFILNYSPATGDDDLQQQLLSFTPDIVHFSGHGELNGLYFQNNNNESLFIHQDSLADFFKLFEGRIRCLLLNACDSEPQAEAIGQYIDFVIGMNAPIGDKAAIAFAKGFYRALFSGEDIENAYLFGCSAIDLAGIDEYQTPILIQKSNHVEDANLTAIDMTQIEEPEGQVPLCSSFYINRPPIEKDCYSAVEKPYALIRIKAPRQMGKTSLLSRVLNHAEKAGQRTAILSFQEADSEIFSSLESLLQWFCAATAEQLGLDENLETYWKGVLGAKSKTGNYFQKYLLKEGLLTLGLDEVDEVFKHPDIAGDFLGLLRAWHEKSKNNAIWKNLRLVITHSKEVYIPLHLNQSPFNVGLPIELSEFTREQTVKLMQGHGLEWSTSQLDQFIKMVDGHPYLVRQGLYQIAKKSLTLATFLQLAPTEEGLYRNHLRRHLLNIQQAELEAVTSEVMNADSPVLIDSSDAFKLKSLGVVRHRGNDVEPLCDLYRFYFQDRL
ncbi:MAG: AAA-like domain-containing protein [Methylococcales bacterium]|nr:AAA-like domain-containing protein [Methylococcales bacterium]